MFPKVPVNPVISPVQSSQARKSTLVIDQSLAFGFKEKKKFSLGVKLKQLHVSNTSDEGFNDDLESKWTFTVITVKNDNITKVSGENVNWENSDLGASNFVLNIDFSPLEISSDTDKLVIDVTGLDEDDWPNPSDIFPSINKQWLKDEGTWGSDSTTLPGGGKGDHIENLPPGSDTGDIDYALSYNIRVINRPNEEK
jgi:hypothetical protein